MVNFLFHQHAALVKCICYNWRVSNDTWLLMIQESPIIGVWIFGSFDTSSWSGGIKDRDDKENDTGSLK